MLLIRVWVDLSLQSPKLQDWNLTIWLFRVISRTPVERGILLSLQKCSRCILQLQLTELNTECSEQQRFLQMNKRTNYTWFEREHQNYSVFFNNTSTYLSAKVFVGYPRGVMVKAMDFGIVVCEFKFQSRYYVDFQANTLGKGMNPLFLPAMG